MTEKTQDPQRDEPKQKTFKGETIPVPIREEVLRDLRKVAKAPKPSADDEGGAAKK